MIYDNVVVGSGFSALVCIVELLNSNKKVLCIDKSSKLNPNNELSYSSSLKSGLILAIAFSPFFGALYTAVFRSNHILTPFSNFSF